MSKLPVGVNVRVNGCMSLCVPCDGLAACPGCTLPSPYVSWDRLQRPRDPNEDEAVLIMDGWITVNIIFFGVDQGGWGQALWHSIGQLPLVLTLLNDLKYRSPLLVLSCCIFKTFYVCFLSSVVST